MEVLIRWALGTSLLILLVLALRLLLRDRLSARVRYALWAVVLLRLLIPFQVPVPQAPSPVLSQQLNNYVQREDLYAFRTGPVDIPQESVEQMLHSFQPGDVTSYSIRSISILGIPVEYYPDCDVITPQGIVRYAFYLPLSQALMLLYLLGAGVLGSALIWSNRRFSRTLRLDRRLDADCPLPVYVVPGLSSPCLFGLWLPNIYLPPEVAQDETVLRHALAHEYTHFRHRDHIWSALRCLVLVLHWYNPLVWAAAYLSRQDGELACDEGAIRQLGEDERIPYGRTLVSLVARRGPRPRDVLTCSTTMAQGSRGIRQRVIRLVKRPHTVKTALFLAASALILAAVVSFVKPPEIHSYQAFLRALDQSDTIRNFRQPLPVYRSDRLEKIRALLSSGQEASDSLQPAPDHAGACPQYWLMVKDWKETPSFYLCNCAGEDRLWMSTGPVSWQSLAVYPDGSQGRSAVTHYTVAERFNYTTLVECRLETGRTHQIRVHMKYIGHPLFNDARYGGDQILKGLPTAKYRQFVQNCFDLCPRQALHAATLGFTHPTTRERLFFNSPLPQDMSELLAKWRNYSANRKNFEK